MGRHNGIVVYGTQNRNVMQHGINGAEKRTKGKQRNMKA
jgi:hypothetical protein